jgi:hypothetical protein
MRHGRAYLRALACKMHAKNPSDAAQLARIRGFSGKLQALEAVRMNADDAKTRRELRLFACKNIAG